MPTTKKPLSSQKTTTARPNGVAINDIHFALKTLESAEFALTSAVLKANELGVRLVIGGDLTEGKANLRSEVIRVILKVLRQAKLPPYVIIGNHDRDNEKALPHALEFLADLADVVWAAPHFDRNMNLYMIPYAPSNELFMEWLAEAPNTSVPYVHQGVLGAFMGEYVVDRSSVDPSVFDRFQYGAIAGHYHRGQKIGNLTYLGSPFTQSYAEAHDGEKGYHILYSDGSRKLVELELPHHYVVEVNVKDLPRLDRYPNALDKVWLKVSGPGSELSKIDKTALGEKILGHANFKLDRIATDSAEKSKTVKKKTVYKDLVAEEVKLSAETPEMKATIASVLKELEA